jgi:hypothetical protein
MKLIKNIIISRNYGVAPSTVTNWIERARKGSINLQIAERNGKFYIVDTTNNHNLIEQLSKEGRVFKSKDSKKTISVTSNFFKVFEKQAVADIILSIEKNSEIPHKYTYINGGAEIWKAYANRSFEEKIQNTVTNSSEMMNLSYDFVISRASKKTKFNIVDIGPGDVSPVKDFLVKLDKKKLINRYVAVDLSAGMLDIAEENIQTWFNGQLPFEKFVRDISRDSIRDILFFNPNNAEKDVEIINLILFIGSTIENQLDAYKTLLNLTDSLSVNDYLFLGQTIDSPKAKVYFDFGSKMTSTIQKLPQQAKWIPDHLGIIEDYYSVEMCFDEKSRTRKMDIIFNTDIELNLKFQDIDTELEFLKGQRLTVWRHKHHSFKEVINDLAVIRQFVDFYVVSKDRAQILTISRPVES